jgi:CBS domain-containing membrane protein
MVALVARCRAAEQRLTLQCQLVEPVPLFGGTGHHHNPVIGEGGRLVGSITQSDAVAAFARAAAPA